MNSNLKSIQKYYFFSIILLISNSFLIFFSAYFYSLKIWENSIESKIKTEINNKIFQSKNKLINSLHLFDLLLKECEVPFESCQKFIEPYLNLQGLKVLELGDENGVVLHRFHNKNKKGDSKINQSIIKMH